MRNRPQFRLRSRVFFAVILGALLPLVLVTLWSQLERPVPNTIVRAAVDAASEARLAIATLGSLEAAKSRLEEIARGRGARIRVVDVSGREVLDIDRDVTADALNRTERFFFGALSPEEGAHLEARRGPVLGRAEVRLAAGDHASEKAAPLDGPTGTTQSLTEPAPIGTRAYPSSGRSLQGVPRATNDGIGYNCEAEEVVACGAAATVAIGGKPFVLHVEKTSVRAVAAVYALRYQLARIGILTLPLAFLLAIYAARRLMQPIERLRESALKKAAARDAVPDLPEGRDEVGDLSFAFNRLLTALRDQRSEHSAALSDLVHELKSPIAAVRSVSELLANQNDDGRSKKLQEILLESSKKMDAVVSQYLDLARVEAGLPNESRTVFEVKTLVEGCIADVALGSGVGIESALAGLGGACIRGVEPRVRSAVKELLENASSFTREGSLVKVEGRLEGENCVLEVRDHGPGIPSETIARVFDRFFTTRGDKRGTGLGLAIVRATAVAHDGLVAVRSEEGAGTVFTLTLPAAKPQ